MKAISRGLGVGFIWREISALTFRAKLEAPLLAAQEHRTQPRSVLEPCSID